MSGDVGLDEVGLQPSVDPLVDDAARALPGAAGRQLGQRLGGARELAELGGGVRREPLRQGQPQRLLGQRPVGQQLGQRGVERVAVDLPGGADGLAHLDLAVVHRHGPLAQGERVVAGEQVDRAAHHQQPDQGLVLEPAGDVVRVEVGEPRRQREVRRQVVLGLQPDQVLRHLDGRGVDAFEQVLAVQQGPVQDVFAEPHCTMIVLVSSVGPPPSPPDGSSVIATKVYSPGVRPVTSTSVCQG